MGYNFHVMKQTVIFLIVLIFTVSMSFAQTNELIGTVSSLHGKSLTNTHILDLNSRKGTVTDEFGKFVLSVSDSGTVLRVSHVGYRPELYKVAPVDTYYKSDLAQRASITLSTESTLLSSVMIKPQEKTVLDGRRGVVLRDFSFADGNNLLLMAEDGIRHLVLCNDRWQETSRLEVGKLGDRLYEDCLGNVHLFGEDSVYQIEVNSNGIELVFASEQSYFLEQLAHCSASSKSHIFFSSYQKAGQEVYHYGLNRETKEGSILARVFNDEGLQDIEDYFNDLPYQRRFNSRFRRAGSSYANERLAAMQTASCCLNGNTPIASGVMGNCIDPITIYRYRRGMQSSWSYRNTSNFSGSLSDNFGGSQSQYFQSVSNRQLEQQNAMLNTWSPSPRDRGWINLLSQPTYSPLFNLRDSIYVFDHVLGVCYVHNQEGAQVRTFPIEHQEIKGWRNLLVADANGQKLYAHVKQRNKVYLMEIDLDGGQVLRSALLQDAAFADQLKVKDGYAYYLKECRDILMSDRIMKVQL